MNKVGEKMNIIGIDVSKKKLDVLWLKDLSTHKVKTKVFANTAKGHQEIAAWAVKLSRAKLAQTEFVMEATGIYHEALAYALFEAGARVVVVNPAKIKAHATSLGVRTKTDKKDSFVIAHYGFTMQPLAWQPEPMEVRELKALIARQQALEKDIQREENRLEKAQFIQASGVIQTSIVSMIEVLKQQRKTLQAEVNRHIDQDSRLKKDQRLLRSIPAIGPVVSALMLSVIHSRTFNCATQCSAFLGLNPVMRESGSSLHGRPRLSKMGNAQIRAKLYMAAVVATKHNPDIKQQYLRLLRNGKSKMSALCAAMRKLVQICFGVLKHQTEYQPQVSI